MQIGKYNLDLVYITPALLCLLALVAGIVPSVFCLNSSVFAAISVGIFLFSLLAHVYILFLWKRYKDSSPMAYAITQPAAHFIILAFALAVGGTSMCSLEVPRTDAAGLTDNPLITIDDTIAEIIAADE